MIQQELVDLLICPNCRGPIEYRQGKEEEEEVVACVGDCRYEYPVVNDIPHMLVDEARKPASGGE